MKRTQLGEFEEIVLLIIGILGDDSYGVSIKDEIEERTMRKPSIGALHTALNRLEDKGFIKSKEGGATSTRGGRRKRFYKLTNPGKAALTAAKELRTGLYEMVPGLK